MMASSNVFLEADLSQAEDRVVKVLAYAVIAKTAEFDRAYLDELLWRARAMPWENDEHKRAAVAIFKVPLKQVNKDQRYLGKKTRHATNYDMHGKRLSEELLKEGTVITPKEGDRMIESVHQADPYVRKWHAAIRAEIMKGAKLTNTYGRTIDFSYERLGDDLYRRGYAYKPQSGVADLLNQEGLIPLHTFVRTLRDERVHINLQVHDALITSTPPKHVYTIMSFLKKSLEVTRLYEGIPLMIPVEFKLGTSWKTSYEFKRFPSADEVAEACRSLLAASPEPSSTACRATPRPTLEATA